VDESVQELVCQSRRGDAAAFAQLIARYERTALAIAYAACGCADLAAEAVQEAFFRAWQRLGSLRDVARFEPWLAQIVQRSAVDQRRSASRQPVARLSESHTDPRQPPDPSAELTIRESSDRIREALAALDSLSRTAIVLRYYEGLPIKRIAELLESTPAAIDMRLMRARQELKRMLNPAPAPAR